MSHDRTDGLTYGDLTHGDFEKIDVALKTAGIKSCEDVTATTRRHAFDAIGTDAHDRHALGLFFKKNLTNSNQKERVSA